MVNYVTDTSRWEKWQRDYRLGLILIMAGVAAMTIPRGGYRARISRYRAGLKEWRHGPD